MRAVQKKFSIGRILVFCTLVLLAVTTLAPFMFMVMTTFKTKTEYTSSLMALPSKVQWANYKYIFENFEVFKFNVNSFKITILSVFFSVLITSMAGFAISKIAFKGKKILFALIAFCMVMPGQVTFIPVYGLISRMGLVNTHFAVILLYVGSSIPFTTFLMAANCGGIDNGIMESARIDGANIVTIFVRMILPLLKSTIAAVSILNFLSYWNELFYAMIILQKEYLRTLTVALTSLVGRYGGNMPIVYTGLFLNCIPVIIIFFVFQKQLIQGVSDGAIK